MESIAMKFHINPETGRAGQCTATIKDCRYAVNGEIPEHYDSKEEAHVAYEKTMSDKNLMLTSFKKNNETSQKALKRDESVSRVNDSSNVAPLRRTPLKHLESADLAKVIQAEASELGMNVEKITEAIDLATALHANQTRGPRWQNGKFMKKVPYIEHPLRNSLRLIRLGVEDEDIINAAILHDTVEDGSQEFAKKYLNKDLDEIEARKELSQHIEENYGSNVSEMVQAVTNEYVPTKTIQSMTMEARHKVYRDHVDENIKDNPGALMVKISDFIDNATGLYHNDIQGQEKGTLKRASKYLPVVDIFRKRMSEMKLPISEENKEVILGQLDRTTVRLSNIIQKYDNVKL